MLQSESGYFMAGLSFCSVKSALEGVTGSSWQVWRAELSGLPAYLCGNEPYQL